MNFHDEGQPDQKNRLMEHQGPENKNGYLGAHYAPTEQSVPEAINQSSGKRSYEMHFADTVHNQMGMEEHYFDLGFPEQNYMGHAHTQMMGYPPGSSHMHVNMPIHQQDGSDRSLSHSDSLTPKLEYEDIRGSNSPQTRSGGAQRGMPQNMTTQGMNVPSASPGELRPYQSPAQAQGQTQQTHPATGQQADNGQPTLELYKKPPAPPEILRSRDVKSRACDTCRKRKITCYILEGSSQCCRCQIENLGCTFTKGTAGASGASKSTRAGPSRRKPSRQANNAAGVLDSYSHVPGKSLLKRTMGLHPQHSSFFVGHTGIFEAKVLGAIDLGRLGQAEISKTLTVRKMDRNDYFITRAHADVGKWAAECDAIEGVVAPYGSNLAQTYFRFCHGNNPVLHEEVFFEKLNRTHLELSPALMGAVYYLASRWWYHDSELGSAPRPIQLESSLYEKAVEAFFRASSRPTLSLIQAGLLLQQCSPSYTYNLAISSIITSQAHRIALNKDCSQWKLPKLERDLRHRLGWAVYGQSKWLSLIEAIPSQTQDSAWHLVPLDSDNFETGNLGPANPTMFIEMSRLSLIIGEIHEVLLACHPAKLLEPVLDAVAPVLGKLAQFRRNLPASLLISSQELPADDPANGNHTIHLALVAAEISLHRFIISSSVDCPASESKLKQACHEAASECLNDALQLVESLTASSIQAFCHLSCSYNLTVIGVLAALLYTTSAEAGPREHYKQCLRRLTKKFQAHRESDVIRMALQSLLSSVCGVSDLVDLAS